MDKETLRYIEWIKIHLDRKRGKTQSGLAQHLGIAHPQITMLMRGKRRLKVDEIPKIAEYLGVEPPSTEVPEAPSPTDIERFLRSIPYLTEENITAVLSVINGFKVVNKAQSGPDALRDQSEPATLPHAEKPSSRR